MIGEATAAGWNNSHFYSQPMSARCTYLVCMHLANPVLPCMLGTFLPHAYVHIVETWGLLLVIQYSALELVTLSSLCAVYCRVLV